MFKNQYLIQGTALVLQKGSSEYDEYAQVGVLGASDYFGLFYFLQLNFKLCEISLLSL